MVGDWVYRVDFKEHIPVRILGLEVVNYDTHPKQYVADVFCPKHNNNVGLYMDEICPIPLTAEILERNGWSYNNEDAKYAAETWVGNGLMLQENGIGYRIVVVSDYDDEDTNYTQFVITYIHQLQHALRLAGIEKEIEL